MPDQSANLLPSRTRQEIACAVMFWVALAMMVTISVILFGHSFGEAQRQHRIVSTYQPVQAKVVSSEVHKWEGEHHSVHYDADIRYEYIVNGHTYQSDQLAPLVTYGSEEWANATVARYKAGQPCDAFYDPADPSQAVLLCRYVFSPYKDMLHFAFILTSFCFMLIYLWFAKKPKVALAVNGWFAIAPEFGERQKLLVAKVCAIVWYVACAIPFAHDFLLIPPPHSASAIHTFEFYFAAGLIPIAFLIRYWWMNRNMDEAVVLIEHASAILGQKLRFSVTQTVRQRLELKQASLRLACLGIKKQGKSSSSTVLFETTPAELKKETLHAGEDLKLEGSVTIPANQQPTGRDGTGKYDWIAWKLYLECAIQHAPDYSMEYRLEVKPPAVIEPEPAVKPTSSVHASVIDSPHAGRVMSRSTTVIGTLIGLIPNVIQLSGIALAVSVFLVLFPDKNHTAPFWNLSKPQAQLVFGIGLALVVISSIWGIASPGALRHRYIRALLKREIKQRPDAIVHPDENSLFVEIVPRTNWNRTMWRTETDMGFMVVDSAQREIRFEGDKERFRVPVDALLSCEIEKTTIIANAKPNAPGNFMVVLRAQSGDSVWEAPVTPITGGSIFRSKMRQQAAEALRAKIIALKPITASAPMTTAWR